ncbi:Oidioi.mRNA.OKI2018_I69.chr2.g4445.t1.cds [Oikopleura dioica]|uniref:Oidioi.mRNA.OKI2018_I69.chr2.g4445.t1.cds n=1 Tax=Oikopleura dioica TaxID=34765 RepID=A0ABN7T1M4_OIKDI|nr:Oidioi.mRNA.OKI2018_I69.chr2.g4445.t1.cds [Oikopleura dioica]
MVRHSLMRAPLEELERLERKSSFTKEGDLLQTSSAEKIDRKDYYVAVALVGLIISSCILGVIAFYLNSSAK